MWLAIKLAAGQRIAPMRMRQDQLGLDGAIRYRELFEAHPELERGPDEEISNHFDRLKRAETKEPKLAAGRAKMPSDAMLVDQLGSPEHARRYKTLVRDFPEVERGPDQQIADHYHALKKAFDSGEGLQEDEEKGRGNGGGLTIDRPRPAVQERATPRQVQPMVRGKDEIEAERAWENYTPNDLKGMPQRIPGWFTGDAMSTPPPGYGVPPMSRRDPMATRRAPVSPDARPRQQTRDEWVQGLADKGIYLNPDGSRMSPEQMAAPLPQRPLRGQQIWEPFTRGAKVKSNPLVTGYINGVLADVNE